MSKKINILGKKYGMLTVTGEAPNDKFGNAMWECECECGKIIITKGSRLRSGGVTSCGCKRIKTLIEHNHTKMIDITNQKFGLLTALYPNGTDNNKSIIWHCRCDCGKECDISGNDLRSGNTKSCGCLKNLIGKKFGLLTVVEDTGKRDSNNGQILWKCICDCGNIKECTTRQLKEGISTHCGCQNILSKGEEKIIELLTNNNISFETQKVFLNCRFNNTDRVAKFDFYIPEKNYLIEYDGIQHFKASGWATEEKVKEIQKRDSFKNQWCKENKIPLIRIPYSHYEKLSIKDLLLETSSFII